MNTIALAPNRMKQEAIALAAKVAAWLGEQHVRVLSLPEVAQAAEAPVDVRREGELAEADLLVVFGGDGTVLRWARAVGASGTPVLGVNFGRYGFITEVQPDGVVTALQRCLDGDYYVSERVVLKTTVTRGDKCIGTYHSLNDVVVAKGPLGRMVGLQTFVNERFVASYAADGLVIASPTGSTAYSLSAGGPVVFPDVQVLILTPICPHTLNARSVVIPDSEKVQIRAEHVEESLDVMLAVDGQHTESLCLGDTVEVAKAEYPARLVQMSQHSFYDKLQTRLRWGERIT